MRTIQDIKNEMTEAFMADANIKALYDTNNTWTPQTTFESVFSAVSLENILFYVVAVVNWGLEFLFSKHIEEVQAMEAKMRVGSKEWWRNIAFSYQHGHSLIYNTDTYSFEYATIDEAAQIIKYCDIRELPQGGLYMLVNKADGNDEPEKMTDQTEINGFDFYTKKLKLAGIPFLWQSYSADVVWLYMVVKYDPLIMNAAGELILTPGVKPVENVLKEYLKNIPFGHGKLNKTFLVDEAQKADGVVDAYPNPSYSNWLLTQGESQPSPVAVAQEANAIGGSFVFDIAGINITYVPNV